MWNYVTAPASIIQNAINLREKNEAEEDNEKDKKVQKFQTLTCILKLCFQSLLIP